MPSCHSVPCIRLDLLDNAPRCLSPSSTFDIRDMLNQVKLLPKLLTESFVFDDADDPLYLDDGHSQGVPPFPIGRRPPLFILDSHRTGLPFPVRREAIELGDLFWDEDNVRLLLTIPTIPRMRLIVREQLYVQKWVDTLASDNPPRHIPWTCDKPVMEKKWVAEGSILSAATIKSSTRVLHSGESDTCSRAPAPTQPSAGSHVSTSHVLVRSMDSRALSEESSLTLLRIMTIPPVPSLPNPLPSGSPIVSTSSSAASLATRREKTISDLKLKRSILEQLEYPDMPTAFLGSQGDWPCQLDAFPIPSFTDHQTMLLNLESKYAALGNGELVYTQAELSRPEMARISLHADEWAFTRGLTTFDNCPGATDSQGSREIITGANVFLCGGSPAPAKGPGVVGRRLPLTSVQSLANRSHNPPGVPLPPRPALINPSTPPHVRGILKKAKSVRFEDTIHGEASYHSSSVGSPPPERASPLTISCKRSCTLMRNSHRFSGSHASLKEVPVVGGHTQGKKLSLRSRLPPKINRRPGLVRPNAGKSGASKPTQATAPIKRPCRIVRVEENTDLTAALQIQTKQRGSSITETDIRRGIEGPTKSRLSTPLRNIFWFR